MRAAFFDVDGTLTRDRVWEGLMEYFKVHGGGKLTHLKFWGYHSPLYILHRLGIISQTAFRHPWALHLPWYFRGKTVEEGEYIWEWIVNEYLSQRWWEDSLELVNKHRRAGDLVMFVSASPRPIVDRIAQEKDVHHVAATEPGIKEGMYSGKVDGEVCIGKNKVMLVRKYLVDNGLKVDFEKSFAYADSPGDVDLLEMVGHPVATHPDEDLRLIAEARGWQIFPS